MRDNTARPTPDQLARYEGPVSQSMLRALAHHGYVIVHPDDVPENQSPHYHDSYRTGWNDCRESIFG